MDTSTSASPPAATEASLPRPAALAAGLLVSLPFLVPLHRLPLPSFESEWLAFLAGLLLAACLALGRRIAFPAVALAPVLLAMVLLVQYLQGMFAFTGTWLLALCYLLLAALLAVTGRSFASGSAAALHDAIAWGFACGGSLNALAGLLQAAGWAGAFAPLVPALANGEGSYGMLAQQNHFAAHMALSIAACCHLQSGSRPRRFRWALAGLMLAALLASGSRTGLLMLVLVTVMYFRGHSRTVLAGACVAAAMALAAHQGWLGQVAARLTQWADPWGPRLSAWSHAWRMFQDAPLFGTGFDAFALTLVQQWHGGGKWWGVDQYAHNLLLQLAATCGIAGLLAVVAPLAWAWARRTRGGAVPFAWCVLGIIALHSMLEQPLYYAYFLAPFALVAGTVPQPQWRVARTAVARALAGIACLAMLPVLLALMVEYDDLATSVFRDGAAPASRPGVLLAPVRTLAMPHTAVAADAPVQDRLALNARLMHFAPVPEVMYRHVALLAESGAGEQACVQWRLASQAYPAEAGQYARRLALLVASQPGSFGPLRWCAGRPRP